MLEEDRGYYFLYIQDKKKHLEIVAFRGFEDMNHGINSLRKIFTNRNYRWFFLRQYKVRTRKLSKLKNTFIESRL